MLDIGSTALYIGVPSLPRSEFEEYSTHLFDDWESFVENELQLSDYSLSLNVEEGSIKAVGRIAATLGVFYIGIGQYGSFVTGLETIRSQVRSAGQYLGNRASTPFQSSSSRPKIQQRGESLGRLHNLFAKVQRGEITVEQAMNESQEIFGPDAENVPGLIKDLKLAFELTPLNPEQSEFSLEAVDGESLPPELITPKKPRPPAPRVPLPDPDQYRVEVWRESRRGKRNVRVISL